MATTSTTYVPYDPLRICDLCGDMHRKSEIIRKPGGQFIGPCVPGWRTAIELDRANARQRPFRIRPVKDAKPETWSSPDSYEGDEGEIFNFLARAVASGARYENVTNGDAAPLGTAILQTYGWTAQYLYGLIVENKRPGKWIAEAKTMLATIATTLRARQYGGGLSPFTDAFTGAFLESGASTLVSDDCASCGLAMLYAYRVLGTPVYLVAARQAASYLRNVQAIGSDGVNFTSSDAGGTARLYTGAVAAEVSTSFGVDPGQVFYSNHLFYPSGLLTLRLWKELQATDGDQTIGAATVVNGFDTAPAQPLSQCILDMRVFWANGTRDSAGATYTGLSVTTPREYFNAYPATKPQFAAPGTGRWEYADGDADLGTQVTSLNFATALAELFNYEGSSTQVAEISDWLRTFTSNPAFETPENQSISQLARTTTGELVATDAPATLLTVRDADADYAAIKTNGSSLYDWGAFGLLSTVWGSRHLSSFIEARKVPLGRNQRFYDGQRSDGDHFDWITLRGLCGLSLQTAFATATDGDAPGSTPYPLTSSGTGGAPAMPAGLVFEIRGDVGVTAPGGLLREWKDQSGFGQDLNGYQAGNEVDFGIDTLDGIPGATWPDSYTFFNLKAIWRATPLLASDGTQFGYGTGRHEPRTIFAVIRPSVSPSAFNIAGGCVLQLDSAPPFQCVFDLESNFVVDGMYLWSSAWRDPHTNARQGPNTAASTYNNRGVLCMWQSESYPDLAVSVNGEDKTLTPADMYGGPGIPIAGTTVILGNLEIPIGPGPYANNVNFQGSIFNVMVFERKLPRADIDAVLSRIAGRFPSLGLPVASSFGIVNDAVRAAQFATAFRIAPVEPQQVF